MMNPLLPVALEKRPDFLKALQERYSEVGRHYHNWSHIEQVLASYQTHMGQVCHHQAVLLATYYHDAIYEVPAKTSNEKASALLLLNELVVDEEPEILSLAAAMIEATETHILPTILEASEKEDCALFLDMDMSILGATPDEYEAYAQNIRKEYAIFPEEMYNVGRAKLLKEFLARPCIFETEVFQEEYDSSARENIAREIATLAL